MGLKDSHFFRTATQKAYKDLDVDATGGVDHKEVAIGLLKLYDNLNAKLPIHVLAPTRRDMMELCQKFDKDDDGFISEDEFFELAKVLFGTKKNWRDSLPYIFGRTLLLNLVICPMAASEIVRMVRTKDGRYDLPTAPIAMMLSMIAGYVFKKI